MAKTRRSRKSQESLELPMTPMIDIVFQLLIYFILTLKPMDVAAHLDVFRPSKGAPPKDNIDKPPNLIRIEVFQGAVLLNGTAVDMTDLNRILGKLAEADREQTVMIMCARDSKHNDLVQVLDRCARVGLSNLSVGSMSL